MKTLLVLSVLLCASFAAPAEDKVKAPEAAVEALKEQIVAVPEMEEKMMKAGEVSVPEDSVSVPENAPVFEEARFNSCPNGWSSHGSRCYLFIHQSMNWYSAEEHCHGLGAYLASVSNPTEYIFLQQMALSVGQSTAWLGGFNLQGRWMWIDREGFYYTNWYSQSTPASTYSCLYLNRSAGWRNTQCTTVNRFICSKNRFSC